MATRLIAVTAGGTTFPVDSGGVDYQGKAITALQGGDFAYDNLGGHMCGALRARFTTTDITAIAALFATHPYVAGTFSLILADLSASSPIVADTTVTVATTTGFLVLNSITAPGSGPATAEVEAVGVSANGTSEPVAFGAGTKPTIASNDLYIAAPVGSYVTRDWNIRFTHNIQVIEPPAGTRYPTVAAIGPGSGCELSATLLDKAAWDALATDPVVSAMSVGLQIMDEVTRLPSGSADLAFTITGFLTTSGVSGGASGEATFTINVRGVGEDGGFAISGD